MSAVKERVRLIVDEYFAGSVNAAARTASIPQPTLQRIWAGTTPGPRIAVVSALAAAWGVSLDWLIGGSADGPWGPFRSEIAQSRAIRRAELLQLSRMELIDVALRDVEQQRRKWVTFCAAYGIDPSEDVKKVIGRFNTELEAAEREIL